MEGTAGGYKAAPTSLSLRVTATSVALSGQQKMQSLKAISLRQALRGQAGSKTWLLHYGTDLPWARSTACGFRYLCIKSSTTDWDCILLFLQQLVRSGKREGVSHSLEERSTIFTWHIKSLLHNMRFQYKAIKEFVVVVVFLMINKYSIQAKSFLWILVFTELHLNYYQTDCFTLVVCNIQCFIHIV